MGNLKFLNLGFVGLGRMGSSMVLNLVEHKHKVIAYNRSPKATKKLAKTKGVTGSFSLEEMVKKLSGSGARVVWLMITAGKAVDDTLSTLGSLLKKGDIIIDGGNSYFEDSVRRYIELKKKGIYFLDCGVSGGIEGARKGACMMVGGDLAVFKKVEILFKDMCVKNGYGYMGESGAGHFVKMVHNGIEYGMMGAIAEGVEILQNSKPKINIKEAVKVYTHGSIVESRLMTWLFKSFSTKGYLDSISGKVPKGETEEEMKKLETLGRMDVLRQARLMRAYSRKKERYAGKLIAAMRNQFGGHKVVKRKK